MLDKFTGYLGIAASVIGALTTALTVYAKVRDLRKKWAEAQGTPAPAPAPAPLPQARRLPPRPVPDAVELTPEDEDHDPYVARRPPPRRVDRVALPAAREAVRLPAFALLITAGCGLAFCLIGAMVVAVVPIDDARPAGVRGDRQPAGPTPPSPEAVAAGRAGGALMYLTLALPNVVALWAGWGMLNLRGYNTALAGSLAVMPGTCFCLGVGFPIGAWCLYTLTRPEVKAAFR